MLTELQLEEFRKCIERELGKIYEVIARPGDGSDSNELDQTKVGRLSRMDAMQQQAMNSGILDRLLVKKSRLEAALIRLDNDEFGFCCQCGDVVNPARLHADLGAPFCADCQNAFDSRRKPI